MRVLPYTHSPTPPADPTASSRGKHLVTRAMPGLHLIGDLFGCRDGADLMTNTAALETFCKQAVADAGLTAVGSLFHSFGPGEGVTGTIMLAESHLALHTWPEDNYVTLDVYVCSYSCDNSAKAECLFKTLMQGFQPADPHLHRVARA